MCSQNLKNPYQVIVMSESESISLQEEPQENHFSATQEGSFSELYARSTEESSLSEEKELEERMEAHMTEEEQSSENKSFTHKKKDQKEEYTTQFDNFKKNFSEQTNPEDKLQAAVYFMETSLAQGETPHFRNFWEVRRLCLPLFKENISPALRSQLWAKYSELSKEARRLKEILDEQSAFAVEQIEIAIQALEKDISQFEEQIEKITLFEPLILPQALSGQQAIYQNLQKQLNVLNTKALHINALRKELLKTEMRVRHKNKFFQRLSTAGDKVFPKRKELIKQISQQFTKDVDHFINQHFSKQNSPESFYVLREEIKAFQSLAKVLTLNTHSFTQTRMRLSECWDRIKIEEKERKKERAQQRIIFKQKAEEIAKQIQALKESFGKNEQPIANIQKKIEEIATQIRKEELGREEIRNLREALQEARKLAYEKIKSNEEAHQEQEKERNRQRKEKYQFLRNQAEQLIQEQEAQDADKLIANRDALLAQIQESSLLKSEKQEVERLLKPLRDIITDKREKALLALSEDERQALQQMQNILKQRKERRQEIKNQLEVLRKAAGSSSLDFEKAMNYTNQINEEKERLEKINQAIQEIEQKISESQAKLRG